MGNVLLFAYFGTEPTDYVVYLNGKLDLYQAPTVGDLEDYCPIERIERATLPSTVVDALISSGDTDALPTHCINGAFL